MTDRDALAGCILGHTEMTWLLIHIKNTKSSTKQTMVQAHLEIIEDR